MRATVSRLLRARAPSPAVQRALVALGVLFFCTAPTPGDVGGCAQDPDELDATTFFSNKDYIDCQHCNECGFESRACERACGDKLSQSAFPEGCMPLVHDGEVCLRVLLDTSCDDYRAYVRNESPEAPTECNFCPVKSP